jgi:SMI1 / KNR4 family (SUKH-1)
VGVIDWSGVRARVRALSEDPRSHKLFGANGHGFELRDPLSSAELADAETQFGVQLPGEYRDFLRQVGAGGAGPFYGVFPLVRSGGSWGWEGDGSDLTDVGQLAEPFPGSPADPHALAALLADYPNEEANDDLPDEYDYDALHEAWDARMEALLWHPDRTAGAICLCHEGCALRDWLVVTGPDPGTIWSDRRTDFSDLILTKHTFGTWYMEWLAAQEAAL